VPLECLEFGNIFTQEGQQAAQNPLLESRVMPQRRLLRYLLLGALGLIAGVAALAFAIAIEPKVSAVLIALFSPGLKLAELMAPETHKSIAWTFSWFLRIAIAGNAVFYFAIFGLLAYLADRRRSN